VPASYHKTNADDNRNVHSVEALAKLFVIPECFYPRYKHSGMDMVFQAARTRFPLRIAAGMTELGLLQEALLCYFSATVVLELNGQAI
jgi:hypothetical protein